MWIAKRLREPFFWFFLFSHSYQPLTTSHHRRRLQKANTRFRPRTLRQQHKTPHDLTSELATKHHHHTTSQKSIRTSVKTTLMSKKYHFLKFYLLTIHHIVPNYGTSWHQSTTYHHNHPTHTTWRKYHEKQKITEKKWAKICGWTASGRFAFSRWGVRTPLPSVGDFSNIIRHNVTPFQSLQSVPVFSPSPLPCLTANTFPEQVYFLHLYRLQCL